jgi:molybdopterin adenylyltransferase
MTASASIRAAVLTVSDGVSNGVREDASGRAVRAVLEEAGFDVARHEVVPDERKRIERILRELTDEVPLVVSTGGTGFGPRDVTPEATRAIIDREAPGLAEAMRAAGRDDTPFAALSRGVAGTRGNALVLNLPGSERGAVDSLRAVLAALPHAVRLLSGDTVHGPSDARTADDRLGHTHETQPDARASGSGSVEGELAARRSAREDVVVATAIRIEGDPPCRVGQKMVLGAGGALAGTLGCAEFDEAAIADAPGVLASGTPATRTYTHDLGTVEVFLEPTVRRPRLILFSATPIARAIRRWSAELGFDPLLVESRAERLTAEDRAMASAANIDKLEIDEDTMAVHTDHDAPGVAESVATLLRSPAAFIGVIGSRRHVGPHVERLRAMGFDDDDLARIRTPVGLDIGARSAEEIALAMVAGLVAARHGAGGGWLDRA